MLLGAEPRFVPARSMSRKSVPRGKNKPGFGNPLLPLSSCANFPNWANVRRRYRPGVETAVRVLPGLPNRSIIAAGGRILLHGSFSLTDRRGQSVAELRRPADAAKRRGASPSSSEVSNVSFSVTFFTEAVSEGTMASRQQAREKETDMTTENRERAQAYRNRLFPGFDSPLACTDPEFVERMDNFAFGEVPASDDLDDRTRMMAILPRSSARRPSTCSRPWRRAPSTWASRRWK